MYTQALVPALLEGHITQYRGGGVGQRVGRPILTMESEKWKL